MSVEKLTESNRLLTRLESVGGNVQNVSDRSVRQDPAPSRLRPTDGKNSAQTEKLAKAYLDGHYGTTTIAAYAKWQRHLGYTGKDADGIPGRASLTRLGDRYGFTVVA